MRPATLNAVFIHGAGGGGWEWAVWQRVFTARGWSVLAPDLMPSDHGIAHTRFEDYSAQALAWSMACAAPRVLIGASLGGLLALHVATQAQADALVLINPLPPAGIMPRSARSYPDVVAWGSNRSLANTSASMPDADDAARLFAFRRWRDESGAVLRTAGAGVDVAPCTCPTLILASERDDDVAPAASQALAASLHAEFHLLPGASHVGPLLGRDAGCVAAQAAEWCERALLQNIQLDTRANDA